MTDQCENGIGMVSDLHARFDDNGNQCLDVTELEEMATTANPRGVAVNVGPFTLAIEKGQSANEVVDVFMKLTPAAREAFFKESLPYLREAFLAPLRRFAPAEAMRLKEKESEWQLPNLFSGLSDEQIIDFIRGMGSGRFEFEVPPDQLTSSTHPDSATALKGILSKPPQILAVGEIHPDPDYKGPVSSEIFTREILPLLKSHQYDDLVLEFIPTDLPQSEIDWFMQNGQVDESRTPLLKMYLELLNDGGKSCLNILQQCRKLKINVHGGGVSMIEVAKMLEGSLNTDKAFEFIRDHSREKIEELAASDKRVLFYGGGYHNNTDGEPQNAAFGKTLMQEFDYVEMDLIMPSVECDHVRRNEDPDPTAIYTLRFYENQIPPQGGVNLVRRGENTYSIVFPLENVGSLGFEPRTNRL